jgi:hypothetical protein
MPKPCFSIENSQRYDNADPVVTGQIYYTRTGLPVKAVSSSEDGKTTMRFDGGNTYEVYTYSGRISAYGHHIHDLCLLAKQV